MKTRLVASVALAAALLLGTTGCTLSAIQGSLEQYQPSDGTAADVGDIKVRNLLGLSEDGNDIALIMTIINSGESAASVNFQYENSSGEKTTITISVDGGSTVNVGSGEDAEEVILREAGATVGGLIPVYVQYGDEQGKQVQVPVLDGALSEYTPFLPTPLPSFTPTPTAVPSESPTPAP